MTLMDSLPPDWRAAMLVGRLRTRAGPTPIVVVEGRVVDVTRSAPTVSELLDAWSGTPPGGADLGPLEALSLAPSFQQPGEMKLLPPFDLQCIKACGVTFAVSAVERVIDERARGNAARHRGTQRAAARQSEGQQCVLRDRSVHSPVRLDLHVGRRAPRRGHSAGRRRGRLPTGRPQLDDDDQPRSPRAGATDAQPASISRRSCALPRHDVRADGRSRCSGRRLHAQSWRRRPSVLALPGCTGEQGHHLRSRAAMVGGNRCAHAQSWTARLVTSLVGTIARSALAVVVPATNSKRISSTH